MFGASATLERKEWCGTLVDLTTLSTITYRRALCLGPGFKLHEA